MDSKLAHKLLKFCLEQTKNGNSFFYDYFGHVDMIHVHGTIGKWNAQTNSTNMFDRTFFSATTEEEIDQFITEVKTKLKSV